jgi:hypothetical protein
MEVIEISTKRKRAEAPIAHCKFAGLTVAQAAKALNVSERNVYKAIQVKRLRPDLEPEIMAGRLSLHRAWLMATGNAPPTPYEKLRKAWNGASEDDRRRLLIELQICRPEAAS